MKLPSLNCPRCGKGKLFSSYIKLKINKNCSECGLRLDDYDIGDGPAYFGIFIVSFLVPILAIVVEINFAPALWIHALLWFPSIIFFSYIVLIFSKAMFVKIEYNLKKDGTDKS